MIKTLEVTVFRSADNRPWVTVHNLPGLDAAMTVVQASGLSYALAVAASAASALPLVKKGRIPKRKLSIDIDSGKAA